MAIQKWEAPKDPEEIRDYGINWAPDIGNRTIVGSVWSVVSGSVAIQIDSHTDTTTTVRLTGGTADETCSLLNHVTLSNGEEYEMTCKLSVKSK